ncbi:hypothetical protein QTP70_010828 [Hemibagrus guttatus]|uniref:Uncharacterized protein n=1 Tax=Hemibagrus guttatus TaxID=175788 RepID=A0AAE0VCE1_9TELE|nr:hypothetical protein QTP70_010828 [Hemibagrus guttatus]
MGKCKDLSEFDNDQIVMARRLDQSISKTAALVECSRSVVVSIYQKWTKEGTVVNQQQGHGQPRLINARGGRRLARVIRSNRRATVAQIAEEVLIERKCADGERLQEVCRHHEQKLAEIQAHTIELEQQRKEIERQMALVGHDGTAHLREMLHELKEQEERNEEVLYRLSTQINALQGVKDINVTPDHLDDKGTQHITFDLISSVDGPLSSQIRSLHLAYIQSGGSDPEVLSHLHDLQAEAHTLEQSRPAAELRTRKNRRMKSSHPALDSTVMAVEQENQQLEEQILKLQIDRERHRGRAGHIVSNHTGSELSLIQRHHIHQLSSLQTEISNLKREVEKSRERKTHPPAPKYSPQQHTLMDRHGYDSLGPAPYDPVSGFVIFYDMVLGVDAMFRTIHLVARLFSGGQEIGQPTPMPPVHCQPAGALGYPPRRHAGNYALLAVQQPVQRVQPSPSLYLVVEVQVVGGFGLCDQDMRGWSKLQLFDDHNQVQSGFWKLPVRSLPVSPCLNLGQLNYVPQKGMCDAATHQTLS